MTRQTLRDTLYALLFETGRSSLSEATANRFLNDAMHHVAAWLTAHNLGYFLGTWTATVANTKREWIVPVDLSSAVYPTALRVLWGARKVAGVEKYEPLTISGPDDTDVFAGLYNDSDGPSRPTITVLNQTLALVNAPEAPTTYIAYYVHGLRDMTADTDTPGQSGGQGTANKLPELFQPLIPLYAATVALVAEQAASDGLRQLYEERKSQLIALLPTRQWKR